MNETIGEYRLKVKKKFGNYPAANSDYCKECGKTYGEHTGHDCPEEGLHKDNPEPILVRLGSLAVGEQIELNNMYEFDSKDDALEIFKKEIKNEGDKGTHPTT